MTPTPTPAPGEAFDLEWASKVACDHEGNYDYGQVKDCLINACDEIDRLRALLADHRCDDTTRLAQCQERLAEAEKAVIAAQSLELLAANEREWWACRAIKAEAGAIAEGVNTDSLRRAESAEAALAEMTKERDDSRAARWMKELWWKAVAKVDADRISVLTEALEEISKAPYYLAEATDFYRLVTLAKEALASGPRDDGKKEGET